MALTSDYQYNQNFADGRSVNRDSDLRELIYFALSPPGRQNSLWPVRPELQSLRYLPLYWRIAGSDESMLPPDLQGYAPQITGTRRPTRK